MSRRNSLPLAVTALPPKADIIGGKVKNPRKFPVWCSNKVGHPPPWGDSPGHRYTPGNFNPVEHQGAHGTNAVPKTKNDLTVSS